MTDLPVVIVWGLKATPLLLGGWLVTALLRRASAASRHFVWVLAIAAVLLLPPVTALVPRWEVALPRQGVASGTAQANTGEQGRTPTTTAAPTDGTVRPVADLTRIAEREPSSPVFAPARLLSPQFALGLWAAGAALCLVLVLVSLWRTHRLAYGARAVTDPTVRTQAERIARQLVIRREVEILEATGDAMPMTWGAWRPRVLLPAGFAGWAPSRRQAVLVHELAHVTRLDWTTQLAARVACALYWWHPLAWLAARRLREERELACDDLVLAHGTMASAYAGDLLEIARAFRAAPATALAGVAMARRSQLAGRLLAVLDGSRTRDVLRPRQALSAGATALAVLLPIAALAASSPAPSPASPSSSPSTAPSAPSVWSTSLDWSGGPPVRRSAVQQARASLCDWSASGSRTNSNSTSSNDHRVTVTLVRDDCTITVHSEGEIAFTNDDRDVARISAGGFFEIEERVGRTRRRIEIVSDGGALERRWLVDGDPRTYDDAARAWLADVLLVLMRRAGFDAEARALRIFEQRGAEGLMQEIEQLRSDYVGGLYYRVLFDRAQLTPAQQGRLIEGAARRIDSDYELGNVLKALAARGPLDPGVQRAYVQATGSLDSDYEHRQALDALVRSGDLDQTALDAMLVSARRLDSDYERAELLTATAARYPAGRPIPDSYLAAVSDMDSDYERRRVLDPLLARDRLSPEDRARVLALLADMDSDYERAEILLAVVHGGALDQATRIPFFRAVDAMDSDHERQRVLQAVIQGNTDEATLLGVIASAKGIDSDYSKAEVLVAVARRGLGSDALRSAYLSAVETIDSSYERDRARAAAGLRGA
jgi:beta-lactamase regulating signal transducer with metallopeptidase domain